MQFSHSHPTGCPKVLARSILVCTSNTDHPFSLVMCAPHLSDCSGVMYIECDKSNNYMDSYCFFQRLEARRHVILVLWHYLMFDCCLFAIRKSKRPYALHHILSCSRPYKKQIESGTGQCLLLGWSEFHNLYV